MGVIALLAMVLAVPVMADTCDVNLVHKDPATWIPVSGATGTFVYDTGTGAFTFSATGLNNVEYALINYAEPFGALQNVLAFGTASGGALNLAGTITADFDPTTDDLTQAKIWLVPTADIDPATGEFYNWNPSAILFELYTVPADANTCGDDAGAEFVITGSIAEPPCPVLLGIDVYYGPSSETDFGVMTVGTNSLPDAGQLIVTSQCTAWDVGTPAATNGGYMYNGAVTLADKIMQEDHEAADVFAYVISDWSGFDGAKNTALEITPYDLAYSQLVGAGDAPGQPCRSEGSP